MAVVLASCAACGPKRADHDSRPTLRDDEVVLDPRFEGLPSVVCPDDMRLVKVTAGPEDCWNPPCTGFELDVCGLSIPAGPTMRAQECLGPDDAGQGTVLITSGVEVIGQGCCADGKAEGVWREWYPGGHLAEEMTYKDGVRDGPFRYWERDGRLMDEGVMDQGLPRSPEDGH